MSKFIKETIIALKSYFKVWSFIVEHKLWALLWISVIANLGLFIGLIFALLFGFKGLTKLIDSLIGIVDFPSWLISSIGFVISVITIFSIYRFLALIFLSPLFSYISERVQKIIIGIDNPFSFRQLCFDIIRGIRIAFRNLFLELGLTALFFFLGGITFGLLAPFIPFVLYFVSAYFFGFAMIDYRSEIRRLNTKDSIRLVKNHRGIATGIGIGFKVFILLPLFGILFAPLYAIIAGALAMEEVENTTFI